jgi:hypothetical protein
MANAVEFNSHSQKFMTMTIVVKFVNVDSYCQ